MFRVDLLRLIVAINRLSGNTDIQFDVLAAYKQVNTSDPDRPMPGGDHVLSVL